jgi:hypothetical protein
MCLLENIEHTVILLKLGIHWLAVTISTVAWCCSIVSVLLHGYESYSK